MMMTMRARTLATVEMTWRIAPHFTFMQFTAVSKPNGQGRKKNLIKIAGKRIKIAKTVKIILKNVKAENLKC